MQLINAAYDTLSDPARRAEHDAWILSREAESAREAPPAWARGAWARTRARGFAYATPGGAGHGFDFHATFRTPVDTAALRRHLQRFLWLYVAALVFVALSAGSRGHDATGSIAGRAPWTVVTANPAFTAAEAPSPAVQDDGGRPWRQRSTSAPNGLPWPAHAAALPGFDWGRADGHGEIELDHRRGRSDRYVRLLLVDDGAPLAVRHVFVPAGARFTLSAVTPGRYALQQLDLETGVETRGDTLSIVERVIDGRIEPRRLRVVLGADG